MGEYREHVTITGDASDYESALHGASAETKAAASSWASSLTAAGKKMDAVGKKMQTTGRKMTTWLTLPIVGVGIAATKMALDFDMAFKQIQGLAGKTGVAIGQMKRQVLSLAGQTGQAPVDLANALYYVASASDFAAKHAFPILTLAAKGAEIGMGSVDQVAQTLTKTLNAYQGTGLKTANIMNIITAAAKASSTEVSEFSTGLGPVTGVAAAMGMSFNDLAAGLAAVVNAGVPFDRAVTGYRFLIQSLATPTGPAITALKDLGFTSQWLYDQLQKPGGLQAALQTISDKAATMGEDGRQAFAKIVGGSRGAIVAYDLVGNKAAAATDMVKEMYEAAQDGASNFEDAFKKITTNNPAIAMQKMIAGLKVAAIELGETLIPVLVDDIIPAVQSAVRWFKHLSDEQKSLFVKIGIAVAAGGPLLLLAGGLIRVAGAAAKAVGWLGKLGKVAPAANALTTAGTGAAEGAVASTAAGAAGGAGLSVGTIGLLAVSGFAGAALLAYQNTKNWNDEVDRMLDGFHRQRGAIDEAKGHLEAYASSVDEFRRSQFGNLDFGQAHTGVPGGGTRETREQEEALAKYRHQMEMVVRAHLSASDSGEKWTKTLLKSNPVTHAGAEKIATLVAAIDRFGGHLTATERMEVTNLLKVGDLAGAYAILRGRLDKASGSLKNMPSQHEKAAGAAADQAQKTKILGDRLTGLPDHVKTKVDVDGVDQGISKIERLKALFDGMSGRDIRASINIDIARHLSLDHHHSGGPVAGSGDVPIMAEGGEFVIQRRAARRLGMRTLTALNKYHSGGAVGRSGGIRPGDVPTKPTSGDGDDPRLKPWQRKLLRKYLGQATHNSPVHVRPQHKEWVKATPGHWTLGPDNKPKWVPGDKGHFEQVDAELIQPHEVEGTGVRGGWNYGPNAKIMRRLLREANREGVGRKGIEALMSKNFLLSTGGPNGGPELLKAAIKSGDIKALARFAVNHKGEAWSGEGSQQSYLFGKFPELQALYFKQLGWSADRIRVAQQTGHDPGEGGSSSYWYQNWLEGMKPGHGHGRDALSRLMVKNNAYGIPTTYARDAMNGLPPGLDSLGGSDFSGSGGSGGSSIGSSGGGGGGGGGGSVTIDGLTPAAQGQMAAAVAQGVARVQGSGGASIADQLRALSLEGSLRSGGV